MELVSAEKMGLFNLFSIFGSLDWNNTIIVMPSAFAADDFSLRFLIDKGVSDDKIFMIRHNRFRNNDSNGWVARYHNINKRHRLIIGDCDNVGQLVLHITYANPDKEFINLIIVQARHCDISYARLLMKELVAEKLLKQPDENQINFFLNMMTELEMTPDPKPGIQINEMKILTKCVEGIGDYIRISNVKVYQTDMKGIQDVISSLGGD